MLELGKVLLLALLGLACAVICLQILEENHGE